MLFANTLHVQEKNNTLPYIHFLDIFSNEVPVAKTDINGRNCLVAAVLWRIMKRQDLSSNPTIWRTRFEQGRGKTTEGSED
jgi:hypothetical protein